MISHQEIWRYAREASRRLDGLRDGSVPVPDEQVLQELEAAVEVLRATGEELRAQNDELLDLLGELDGERFRSRNLFELAPTPLLTTDRMGRIRDANQAALRLLGVRDALYRRKPLSLFVEADDRRRFRGYLDRVRRSDPGADFGPGEIELGVSALDGPPVPVRVAARPVPHTREGGDVLWNLQDLRPAREREEALRRLAQEKAEREAAQEVVRRVLFLLRSLAGLSRIADPREVAQRAAELAASEFGALAVVDVVEGGAVWRVAAGPGAGAVGASPPALRDDALLATLLDTGSGIHERGAQDGRVRHHLVGAADAELPDGLTPRSILVLPMLAPRGVVGGLTLARSEDGELLEPRQSLLARGFAQVAGMALEQALRHQDVAAERARLHSLSQERFQALTALSHELRTPLHSILGYCDLLLQGVHGDVGPRARRALEAVRSSARHQTELVDGVLHLFRPERAGEAEHATTSVVVQDVVREAATMVEELAQRKDLALRLELPKAPVTARLDAAKLRQVLVNLLGNAVKYTDRGYVRLTAACPADRLCIEVEDTGDGIGAAELPHVFEPFWRSGDNRGGSGLGLAVTQRLVTLMGGDVSARSEPGRGSVFRVEVPTGAADEESGRGS